MPAEPEMDLFDLSRPRRVHVVAVGGAGMSAIAMVLAGAGHHVTGSDASESPNLEALRRAGIEVAVGHDARAVRGAEVVVVSSAVPADNVEVEAALAAGLPVLSRREFLPAMAARQPLLSVTGTHGKTTTSSMLAVALRGTGTPISWLIGAPVPALGSAAEYNDGPWMVLEADESDGSFLAGPRAGAVVTNLEADHLEYWGDWDSLVGAFGEFVDGTGGPVALCADDPGAAALLEAARDGDRRVTYGSGDVDYAMSDLHIDEGWSRFDLVSPAGRHPVRLRLPGRHNALNATGALALVSELGLDLGPAIEALEAHTGVHRRFDRRGSAAGVEVVDDYAHLPTEVAAALEAGSMAAKGRLVVVFQPHRYSRTQALWSEFAQCFGAADVLVLTDIYPAGEPPREGVSGKLIHDAVTTRGSSKGASAVVWAPSLGDVARALEGILREGDLLMTVGAGDVRDIGDVVLEARGGSPRGSGGS